MMDAGAATNRLRRLRVHLNPAVDPRQRHGRLGASCPSDQPHAIAPTTCSTTAAAGNSYWHGHSVNWRSMMAEPPAVVADEHPEMEMEWLQPFGLAVRGVDPRSLSEESSSYFEAVMAVHGLVLFRGLGTLSADDQLAASSRFGTGIIYSTHKIHPAAEHSEVFRLSNDERHGFAGAGGGAQRDDRPWGDPRNGHGWHHDGMHDAAPFGHVSYHLPVVPKLGQTCFAHTGIAMDRLLLSDPDVVEQAAQLCTLHSHSGELRPMVYVSPVTQRLQLLAHFGQIGAVLRFVEGDAVENGVEMAVEPLEVEEMQPLLMALYSALDSPECEYAHQWEEGDLIVSNNLTVAHRTGAGAHASTDEVGLRVLHRVTVMGRHDLSPSPFRPYADWLDTPADEEEGRREFANPFGRGAWDDSYSGINWRGSSRPSSSDADENARH